MIMFTLLITLYLLLHSLLSHFLCVYTLLRVNIKKIYIKIVLLFRIATLTQIITKHNFLYYDLIMFAIMVLTLIIFTIMLPDIEFYIHYPDLDLIFSYKFFLKFKISFYDLV